jgi:hypothetical protein
MIEEAQNFIVMHPSTGLWMLLGSVTFLVIQNMVRGRTISDLRGTIATLEMNQTSREGDADRMITRFSKVVEQRDRLEGQLAAETERSIYHQNMATGLLDDLRRERERSVTVKMDENGVTVAAGYRPESDSEPEPSVGDEMA